MVVPSGTPYDAERTAAIQAVVLANQLARGVQQTMDLQETLSKADASPVTVADFAVQALIVSRLHAAFPSDKFIAEESSDALRADPALLNAVSTVAGMAPRAVLRAIDLCAHAGADGARTWILDPIDGTRGFIAQRHYCVALGLLERGQARVGVLGCPNLRAGAGAAPGCVFHAVHAQGAFVLAETDVDARRPGGVARGKRCFVSKVADPAAAVFCESVEKGHSSHATSARVAAILGVVAPPLRMDSQAKYGCMARGDASIFLRFPRAGYVENVWDSAPAAIVIEEAGGRVTDGRGRPLDFSLGRKLDNDDGIVATNGLVHDAVINAVQQALLESNMKTPV